MKALRAKQILVTGLVALVLVAGYYRWTEENKTLEVANKGMITKNDETNDEISKEYDDFEDESVVYVNAEAEPQSTAISQGTDFSEARRERDSVRGRSVDILKEITEDENSTDEAKQEAQKKISDAAANTQSEGIIEGLVKTKGYSDCITYIENGEVRVIVQGNVLDAGSVSQIKDIVVSQTGILPKNIKISSQE